MNNWKAIKYFTENEFRCPCGGKCNIDMEFVSMLDEAREIAGIPFHINSGCRCKEHNTEVGGRENSAHIFTKYLKTTAADIKCKTYRRRFIIVRALQEAGFTHIGIASDFIHVDSDQRKAIWLY